MSRKLLKNESGFTLIELMVVVAIIGVLSAIAVPNFKKYQAKAKQSEAKIQLAAVYTTEVGAMADYDTYANCLSGLGYDTEPRGYYVVGFSLQDSNDAENQVVSSRGNAQCDNSSYLAIPGTLLKAGGTAPSAVAATNLLTAISFIAGARGNISSTNVDDWSITEAKTLTNVPGGY